MGSWENARFEELPGFPRAWSPSVRAEARRVAGAALLVRSVGPAPPNGLEAAGHLYELLTVDGRAIDEGMAVAERCPRREVVR